MTELHKATTLTIGVHAARVQRTGHATVAAVFGAVFYLRTASGLICVTARDIDNGPISIRTNATCDWQRIGLRTDQRAEISGQHLRIPGLLHIDCASARIWEPEIRPVAIDPRTLSTSLRTLRNRPMSCDTSNGFAAFLTPGFSPQPTDYVGQRAAPLISDARLWLVDIEQNYVAPDWAVSLLGAGPGLTPSGDDFLGGILIGLHSTGRTETAETLWSRIKPYLPHRTNGISAALLCAAACGYGSAAIHAAIGALFRNDSEALDTALAAVGQIGHSSGWDTMLGIVTVLDACTAAPRNCAA